MHQERSDSLPRRIGFSSGKNKPVSSTDDTRYTATAHLFIADPFGGDKRSLKQKISGLFQTHPPAERSYPHLAWYGHLNPYGT